MTAYSGAELIDQVAVNRSDSSAASEAQRCWQSLLRSRSSGSGISGDVTGVEVLKRANRRSAVFRLKEANGGGQSVIAKRSSIHTARVEHRVYTDLLMSAPVRSIRCYGLAPAEDPELMWIFLEDAGDERFDRSIPEHRVLAAEWLGAAHLWTTGHRPDFALPDRGPAYQLGVVRKAKDVLVAGSSASTLSADQHQTIDSLLRGFSLLEANWAMIETDLAALPATLVHSDLAGNNARMRVTADSISFLPLDFGDCGRGVPAADLSQVDVAAYLAFIGSSWPHVGLDRLLRISAAGTILWSAAAIPGERASFGQPWMDYLFRKLSFYDESVSSAVDELGLT